MINGLAAYRKRSFIGNVHGLTLASRYSFLLSSREFFSHRVPCSKPRNPLYSTRVTIRNGVQERANVFTRLRPLFRVQLRIHQGPNLESAPSPPAHNAGPGTKIHTSPLPSPLSPPSGTLNVYCLIEPLVGRLHLSNCLLYLKLGLIDTNPLCVFLKAGIKLGNWHSRDLERGSRSISVLGGLSLALEVMRYY